MNSEIKIVSIIGIITIIIIALGLFFSAGSSTGGKAVTIQQNILVASDSPRLHGANSKIQIVEFGDFECPACAALAPNLTRLLATYKDNIDYVFRIIPIHPHSKDAAVAAYAAGEQGKFFEMGDILFSRQSEWSTNATPSSLFEKYATNLGLDIEKYKADAVNNKAKYDASVDRDAKDASTMQVNSTPTLIIDGKLVLRGAIPYEQLKAMVESAISNNNSTTTATSTVKVVNVKI